MARTISHTLFALGLLPVLVAMGDQRCARTDSWPWRSRNRRRDAVGPSRPRGTCLSRPALGTLLLLKPMNHILTRHLFSNRNDIARHDVRRGHLTEVLARIHPPQPIAFTHQTDTRPIFFHDRETPTVSLSHDVGDGGSLRPRADREDRVLETTTA